MILATAVPAVLTGDQLAAAKEQLLGGLGWDGPVHEISAVTGKGTQALGQAVMQYLDALDDPPALC